MKKTIILFFGLTLTAAAMAQKKTTTSAVISFDASTAIDNLPKAVNKTAIGALDTKKGSIQFEAAVKNFAFSNPSIQDHFNGKKWMNSEEFPKFSFKGKIANPAKINFKKDGDYDVIVSGDLTIKNITKQVSAPATISVTGGEVNATASFSIKLSDFEITGVPIDAGKIAKEPKITVSAQLK